MREVLLAIGDDPDREGLKKTPSRVAKSYAELMAGLFQNPREHLKTVFHERYDEIVLLRDIPFSSLCEHHLLPFTGRAHVAYLPDGKVVGLSKLAGGSSKASRGARRCRSDSRRKSLMRSGRNCHPSAPHASSKPSTPA